MAAFHEKLRKLEGRAAVLNLPSIFEVAKYLPSKHYFYKKVYKKHDAEVRSETLNNAQGTCLMT